MVKARLYEIVSEIDKFNLDLVKKQLENNDKIENYAWILHDKDENIRFHYHIAIRLKDSYDTKYVSQWFGIPENFIEKVKGRWSDMLKYLTHKNAPTKFQYDDSEVTSNFNWIDIRNKSDETRLTEIAQGIKDGIIRKFNYPNYMTEVEYSKYNRHIKNYWEYRADKIKEVSREMDAIYITGPSGIGKTTYAKIIAENHGYSCYVSSGSNDVLDDYKGQDCIILDDLRSESFGSVSDLIKLLDNHTASSVKSRYVNKVLECKLIIITTIHDMETFFNKLYGGDTETIKQLKRRCQVFMKMSEDYIEVRVWDDNIGAYSQPSYISNVIRDKFKKDELTPEMINNKIQKTLGGLAGVLLTAADIMEKNKVKNKKLDDDTLPF